MPIPLSSGPKTAPPSPARECPGRPLVLDDHVEPVAGHEEYDGDRAIVALVGVTHGITAGLGHRKLQIREQLVPHGQHAGEAEAPAGREAGSPPSPGRSAGRRRHSLPVDTSSSLPRIFASARRSRRETCICEMPTSAAIWDCVISRRNRSSTIRRSRSSRASSPAAMSDPSSTSSYPTSSMPSLSARLSSPSCSSGA